MFRNTEYGSGYTCRSHAPRSKSSPPIKSSCGACRCRHRHYTNDKHVAQYCGTRSRLLPSGTIASEYRTGIDRSWKLFVLQLYISHLDRFSMPEDAAETGFFTDGSAASVADALRTRNIGVIQFAQNFDVVPALVGVAHNLGHPSAV
jgi:hypothetical protein